MGISGVGELEGNPEWQNILADRYVVRYTRHA